MIMKQNSCFKFVSHAIYHALTLSTISGINSMSVQMFLTINVHDSFAAPSNAHEFQIRGVPILANSKQRSKRNPPPPGGSFWGGFAFEFTIQVNPRRFKSFSSRPCRLLIRLSKSFKGKGELRTESKVGSLRLPHIDILVWQNSLKSFWNIPRCLHQVWHE